MGAGERKPEVAIWPGCNVIGCAIAAWNVEGSELARSGHFHDQAGAIGEPEVAVRPRRDLIGVAVGTVRERKRGEVPCRGDTPDPARAIREVEVPTRPCRNVPDIAGFRDRERGQLPARSEPPDLVRGGSADVIEQGQPERAIRAVGDVGRGVHSMKPDQGTGSLPGDSSDHVILELGKPEVAIRACRKSLRHTYI